MRLKHKREKTILPLYKDRGFDCKVAKKLPWFKNKCVGQQYHTSVFQSAAAYSEAPASFADCRLQFVSSTSAVSGSKRRKIVEYEKIRFSHIEPVPVRYPVFSLIESWFKKGDKLLLAGYGSLYGVDHFNITSESMTLFCIPVYSCGCNYFEFVKRIFTHFYKFAEVHSGYREKKQKFLLEMLDMVMSLILAAATTLTLLKYVKVFVGTWAIICAPLGSFATNLCSVVMGFIELVKCYKAYQKTKMLVMLRDRLKRFTRMKTALSDPKFNLKARYRKKLESERDAMLEQSIAIARVGLQNKKITEVELDKLLNDLKFQNNPDVNKLILTKTPLKHEMDMVQFVQNRHRNVVQLHSVNAGFCFLIGLGGCLMTMATAIFPPLLIPGIIFTVLAIAFKVVNIFELDKRIYNVFVSQKNQKRLENDNPIANYLAQRKEKKFLYKKYKNDYDKNLSLVDDVICEKNKLHPTKIKISTKIEMLLAYKLSLQECEEQNVTERQFYGQLLDLPRRARGKVLKNAIKKYIREKATSHCLFAKGLTEEDKKYYAKKKIHRRLPDWLLNRPKLACSKTISKVSTQMQQGKERLKTLFA